MKKIFLSITTLFLIFGLIANSFAYTLTAKDKNLVDNLTTKVEQIIEKKGEQIREPLIKQIKKLADKYKKQARLEMILLQVIENIDNNLEKEFDNILNDNQINNNENETIYITDKKVIQNIFYNDNTKILTWDYIDGVDEYHIYIGGYNGYFKISNTNSVEMPYEYRKGNQEIIVQGYKGVNPIAEGKINIYITDKKVIQNISYNDNTKILTWDYIDGVDEYHIYIGGYNGYFKISKTNSVEMPYEHRKGNQEIIIQGDDGKKPIAEGKINIYITDKNN